jgi:O-antigen/teichoic acid export membrane protein
MMAAGVELLFNSINSLLLARLVNWTKMGLQAMWRKQTRLLLIFLCIALPLVVLLIISAPLIYKILLGRAFLGGVRVFQILVVGRMVVFLGQIYAWGLVAAKEDSQFLFASLLGAIFSVTLNLFFIPIFGIIGAACVSVISEILVHSYCYLALRAKLINKTGALM